ncbi:MAG: hypothetical protein QOF89_3499 [Acidobacteriota bacterium]|jgi:hypothetical protein|nr:hypothetical protein [Acidobacteriota bacterium]
MSSLVFFTLWLLASPQGGTTAPSTHNQNIVRICSVAAGISPAGCQDLDARLLEPPAPTMAAGGQRAFLDPETKSLVQPTRDQLKELSVLFSESMDKRQDVKAETLPNGTLRLRGESFTIDSKATIEPPTTEKTTEKKP